MEENIVGKHTLLRFIDESKGNTNVVLGTRLSVEIAMFALCKVLSKTSFEKNKKICIIFNKNDSNVRHLMKEKISVVIKKLLSDREFAKKRISLVRGDNVIDSSSGDITVNSVVEQFYINDKWSEYIEAFNEAVDMGIGQIFVLSNSLLFCENMSSIYNKALENNINVWLQWDKSNESLFFQTRYKDGGKMEKLNVLRSTFNGMNEDKYIVNIDWLNSDFESILNGVRFWL